MFFVSKNRSNRLSGQRSRFGWLPERSPGFEVKIDVFRFEKPIEPARTEVFMVTTTTPAALQNLHSQLEFIQQKTIDDNRIFEINQEGKLQLRTRVQSCWEKICECLARIFTNKMVNLRNRFEEITASFEEYLRTEQNIDKRQQVLQQYGTVINEIYRCATRMQASEISGFKHKLERLPLTRNHLVVLQAYQLRAHLPKEIYSYLITHNLLSEADSDKTLQKQQAQGNSTFRIYLKADSDYAELYYTPAPGTEGDYQQEYAFKDRRLVAAAVFEPRPTGGYADYVWTHGITLKDSRRVALDVLKQLSSFSAFSNFALMEGSRTYNSNPSRLLPQKL